MDHRIQGLTELVTVCPYSDNFKFWLPWYSLNKLDTSANESTCFSNLQALGVESSLRSDSTAKGPSGY